MRYRRLGDATLHVSEICLGSWLTAWVLRHPNIASAIVGASRPEQVADNAAASGIDLDDSTLQAIEDVSRETQASGTGAPAARPSRSEG